jgi:hypothetical protein
MHQEASNSVMFFGGKHFKLNVELEQHPPGLRAYIRTVSGGDLETLFEGRGLDGGQLMELALISAMGAVVVGGLNARSSGHDSAR